MAYHTGISNQSCSKNKYAYSSMNIMKNGLNCRLERPGIQSEFLLQRFSMGLREKNTKWDTLKRSPGKAWKGITT